jgi:hypothetical protein
MYFRKDVYGNGHTACFYVAFHFVFVYCGRDRLSGLVVRVPGYRSRGPRFDSRFSEK